MSCAELGGQLCAVRGAQGGLFEQAGHAFLSACRERGPTGGLALPPAVRAAMEAPALLAAAGTALADGGAPPDLINAAAAHWTPPPPAAPEGARLGGRGGAASPPRSPKGLSLIHI